MKKRVRPIRCECTICRCEKRVAPRKGTCDYCFSNIHRDNDGG